LKECVGYSLYLIIWDLEEYLESPKLVSYALSKNTEDRSEWLLASAYISHLFRLEFGDLAGKKLLGDGEVCHC